MNSSQIQLYFQAIIYDGYYRSYGLFNKDYNLYTLDIVFTSYTNLLKPSSGGALSSMEPSQMDVTIRLVVDLDTCRDSAHSSCRLRMRHLVDPVGGDAGDHPGALHRHHRQAPDLSHAAQCRHVAEYLKLASFEISACNYNKNI